VRVVLSANPVNTIYTHQDRPRSQYLTQEIIVTHSEVTKSEICNKIEENKPIGIYRPAK
jgi:hypothetical protein